MGERARPRRMSLEQRTALVTGAGSGIGRALAVSLARRRARLALCDVNAAGLAETKALVAAHGVPCTAHTLDVSDREAVDALPAAVLGSHPGVDLLVNNAGVAIAGGFEEVALEDFAWLMEINFWGVVSMTRAFLPVMRRSADARLVNISSIYGVVAPPGQSAYAASKFAVRGFSMALRHELARSSIGVSVVHPGGVATAIADAARVPASVSPDDVARRKRQFRKLLKLDPAVAAEAIVRGVEARRARILVGRDAKIAALMERVFPANHWTVLRFLAGDGVNRRKARA